MSRAFLLLVLALLLGGMAAWLAAGWLDRTASARARAVSADVATQTILVADADFAPGDAIGPDRRRWQAWPAASIQDDYLVQGKADPKLYADAVARVAIARGEPLRAGNLIRGGDHGVMAALIAPGRRAISIPVTTASGLAGFVGPGDRVDIILTANLRRDGRIVGRTVARNVRVLAVDQRVTVRPAGEEGKGVTAPSTVTLEVTPEQAEQLAVAHELGRLSLSLRDLAARREQAGPPDATVMDMAAIAGRQTPAAETAPAPAAPAREVRSSVVDVVRGGRGGGGQ